MKIDNPCKDCTDRHACCAVDCDRWKEYLVKRDQEYAKRKSFRDYDAYRIERTKRLYGVINKY